MFLFFSVDYNTNDVGDTANIHKYFEEKVI